MNSNLLRRLSLIKHLFSKSLEQIMNPEPVCCLAILTMHDSIELFLQLAAEKHNIGSTDISFMEYFEKLKNAVSTNIEIPYKEEIRRLNRARVAFKHHGIMPSRTDIEAFQVSTTNFFSVNTKLLFNLEYSEISLIDLLQSEKVRNLLKLTNSQQYDEPSQAIINAKIAFYTLIEDFLESKKDSFGYSLYEFGPYKPWSAPSISSSCIDVRDLDELNSFMSYVFETMERMQFAFKLVILGIDYRRYAKFESLSTHVNLTRSNAGDYSVFQLNVPDDYSPSIDDIEYSVEFVIDSALHLQEHEL